MSKATIRILNGSYRNKDVNGLRFELVEQYKKTATGGHVTVRNDDIFPDCPATIRIKVSGVADYEFVNGSAEPAKESKIKEVITETDEEVMVRIRERFEILDEMTKAATNGDIRAMIVSGPPGVGKSFGVEQVVEKACLFDRRQEASCRSC